MKGGQYVDNERAFNLLGDLRTFGVQFSGCSMSIYESWNSDIPESFKMCAIPRLSETCGLSGIFPDTTFLPSVFAMLRHLLELCIVIRNFGSDSIRIAKLHRFVDHQMNSCIYLRLRKNSRIDLISCGFHRFLLAPK